jgi:spore germination protein YaaH
VNWDLDANIDYGAITTVAYFGLAAGADGYLVRRDAKGKTTTEYSRWMGNKVTNAIAQAHANGDKFVLTVERMAWDDGAKANTRSLLNSPAKRVSLAADIVSEIQARGVDGVSLDFEPILSDQRDNFADFVRQLRAALYAANPAYQLTFAATGSQAGKTYQMFGDITNSGAADAVIIMGYPLRAIDAKYAGGLAPYYSATSYDLKQITNAYLGQIQPDRIVMALPWYGREWPTVTSDINAVVQTDRSLFDRPYNIGYQNAIQVAQQYGRIVDPGEMSALTQYRYAAGPGCPETWQQVYYDDVETYAYKLDWLRSKGLAGIGIFALGYDGDQPELWKLLRVKYRGLIDTLAPTGQVAVAPDEKFCQTTSARLTLSADDGPAGSGAVYVRLSNSAATSTDGTLTQGRTYPATTNVTWPLDDAALGGSSALGPRSVYAQWRDVAGNWSTPRPVAFNLDAPAGATIIVGAGNGYAASAAVPVVVTQNGGRTIGRVVAATEPTLLNGVLAQTQDLTLGQPGSVTLPGTDGPQHVYVQWQDINGCWSSVQDAAVTVDAVPPAGTLAIADGASASLDGNVRLLAPATDDLSGVAAVEITNDGQTWTSLTPTADAFTWAAAGTAADGAWTVSARWRDAAGNVSATQSVSLTLDRNGPRGVFSVNGGATYTKSTTVQVQPQTDANAMPASQFVLSNDGTLSGGALVNGQSFAPGAAVTWTLAGTTDGPRTVYGQWRDAFGRWSAVTSATIYLDRTAPQVAVPLAGLAPGSRLTSTIDVTVTTQATDSGSGVAQTILEAARNGASWSQVNQGINPERPTTQVDTTGTWQLRSSAVDVAGNVSATVSGRSFRALLTEDSSKSITYKGKWTKASASSASSGTTRYATAKGATATLKFNGSSVAWVASTSNKSGYAKVFIDGVLATKVNLRAAAQSKLVVFATTWASNGTHTIKIKVQGTKGGARVDLDAFIVLA